MPQTIHRGIKALIDEANAEIETLSATEAIKAAQGDDVVIVDIRDPREIERDGRIPGAFSCTRGMLEFWIDPASPYAKPVFQQEKKFIFHCAGGMRSALAAKTAQDMGLKPVAQRHWDYSESTTIIRRLFSERMFPITIDGLEGAMKELVR